MSVEKQLKAKSGYGMLVAVAVALIVIIGLFIWSTIGLASTPDGVDAPAVYGWGLGLGILAFCLWFIPLNGFFSLQPGQARVCILFGKYVGTVRDEGLFWANPFFSKSMGGSAGIGEMIELEMSDSKAAKAAAQKAAKGNPTTISTRVRTLNGERLKVNDKMGNPIEIATVVVWHVADTAKALFDVDDYQSYVAMQAETALRHVASVYAYDHLEDESDAAGAITLRANVEEVSEALRRELAMRLAPGARRRRGRRCTSHAPRLLPRDRPGDAAPPAGRGRHRRTQEDRRGRGLHGRHGREGDGCRRHHRARRRAQGADGQQPHGGALR